MKKITPAPDWPAVWKASYPYDLCEIYDDGGGDQGYTQAYRMRRDIALGLLQQALPIGSRILDVAAAQGNFTLKMAEMGYRVTWNDLRKDLENYVRLKYEFGDVSYAAGDVFDLDFEGQFDGVLITEIIEHVAHPDEFLQKIAKLIRPGGFIIMTTPNGLYFRNTLPRFSDFANPSVFESRQFGPNSEDHIFLLHPDEIYKLGERAGLRVSDFKLYTTPLTAGHMKLRLLFPFIPKRFVEFLEKAARKLPARVSSRVLLQAAALYQKG